MALNNVERFTITPTEPVQMILGTNGSGKSSLMAELTPLPADPAAYLKDGSKTIYLIHRGRNYILKSTFSPSAKHSFLEDGEELNDGGTASAQRELVRQKFKITPDIHELLIGVEMFHSMGPSRRREWFTQMSDVSYDYALKVYGRLKEKARDLSGALKLARKRLVTETAKIITDEEEVKLRADVEATHRELNLLIEQSAPLERPVAELRQARQQGYDDLTRLSRRLLNTRFSAPTGIHAYGVDPSKPLQRNDWGELIQPGFESVEQIDQYIDTIRHEITSKETLLNKAVAEHGRIEETMAILLKTGEAGQRTLQERIEGVRSQRDEVLALRKLGIEGLHPENATSALESIYEIASAVFTSLPENEDKRFSQQRLADLTAQLLKQKDLRSAKLNQLNHLNANKAHLEAHRKQGNQECPACGHRWVAGFSEAQLQELLELIASKEQEIALVDKEIATLETAIHDIDEYSLLYRDYVRCVKNWPVLQPFWDYLLEGAYVTRSPRKALTILDTFKQDLEHEVQASQLQSQIKELTELMHSAEQVGDATLSETREKLDECTLTIEGLTSELTKLRSKLGEYQQYRKQLMEAGELSQKIGAMMLWQEKANADLIEAIRRETLNHCVRQLQHSLAIKQETLSAAVLQKGIVQDLERNIEMLTVEEEAARMLVKEISPTEGLIAEGLLGFIRGFTGQMNHLIRKIWSYPLQILECGLSSSGTAELDYKFPMMVQTASNVVPDVKQGSTGMREIVDLAFKVVSMRYLDLMESPLYLDEFASSLDKEHRNSGTATVKNLMETQSFTQLFMVSHYESGYGSFTNAQICVLDPRNITVPTTFNEHVTIT